MVDLLLPAKRVYWEFLRKQDIGRANRRELSRMADSKHKASVLISRVISDIMRNRLDRGERQYVKAIEVLRAELASSGQQVTFMDFGAGEPGDDLTSEEMNRGREITISLKRLALHSSQKYPWTHLMLKIIRASKPETCLELGTCIGISAAYQAAALELNKYGRLVTLEGAKPLAELSQKTFERLGLARVIMRFGRFQDTLDGVLQAYMPISFAYVDGHHDELATLNYFERLVPCLSDDAVVLFDDILWYEGMQKAWKKLSSDSRVRTSVDFGVMGLCVVTKNPTDKESFQIQFI